MAGTGGRDGGKSGGRRGWVGDLASLVVVFGLVGAIYLLPPDTSLSEMRAAGYIRACVPADYPPLAVRGGGERPGFEVELLQRVAERLGVRLILNPNSAIGRDLNPRSWQISRANCQIIAGGIVANDTIRSFMDTSPPHLETGWVVLVPGEMPLSLAGLTVGVHVGMAGRDRIALSRLLREQGATIALVNSQTELANGLRRGTFDAGVTESLIGGQTAAQNGWPVAWLPGDRHEPIAFGLWKGDLTLKREVVGVVEALIADGTVEQLAERYGIAEPEIELGAAEEG